MGVDLTGRREELQIQIREPIKSIRIASNFTKWPRLEMAKEDIVHIKHEKEQNEYYSTYGLRFLQKIFKCNPPL